MDWGAEDRVAEFEMFKERMQMYLAVAKVDEKLQYNHIVLFMGEEGTRRWKALGLSQADRESPKKVWDAFEASLEKTQTFWNHVDEYLGDVRQGPSETAAELDVRIQTMVRKCKFPPDQEDQRKLELLFHATRHFEVKKFAKERTRDTITYKDLLEQAKLHERIISEYRHHTGHDGEPVYSAESSLRAAIKTEPKEERSVDKIKSRRGRDNRGNRDHRDQRNRRDQRERQVKCHRCGSSHKRRECPAYGTECYACGGRNHWEKYCNNVTTESEPDSDRTPSRDRDRGRYRRGRGHQRGSNSNSRSFKQYTVFRRDDVEQDFTGEDTDWATDSDEAELSSDVLSYVFT